MTLCSLNIHIPRKQERRQSHPNGTVSRQLVKACPCGAKSKLIAWKSIKSEADHIRSPV